VFRDEETGESREVSLVYPMDSDPEQGRISVLSPVGSALLGLSVGQTIDWPLPRGRLKRIRVVEVVYQPEAAGHLHL
jgi:regulator of nucleoside diphosphate kinase